MASSDESFHAAPSDIGYFGYSGEDSDYIQPSESQSGSGANRNTVVMIICWITA